MKAAAITPPVAIMTTSAERTCGECTVCCIVPAIETPEFAKPAGVTCNHCDGGCRIYETRPVVCREFYCGWRALPELDDTWRPDRSGVLLVQDEVGVPIGHASSVAFKFILTAIPVEPMVTALAAYVLSLVRGRIPVFLAIAASDRTLAKCLINPGLELATASGDITATKRLIAAAAVQLSL